MESFDENLRKIKQELLEVNWNVDFDVITLVSKESLLEVVNCLVGFLGLKSKVSLLLNESVRAEIYSYLAKINRKSKSAWGDESNQKSDSKQISFFIPNNEDFLLAVAGISSIKAISIPNIYQLISKCVEATNILIGCIKNQDSHELERIYEFIKAPPFEEPFISGKVRTKQRHTFIVESKAGPIQIGIPPETIKVSLQKGEDVPRVYVLPSVLFAEDVNFGEVEFPIFFNFFVKRAFSNNSMKPIIIGDKEHLRRVKAVFKESVFGPDQDQIYVDSEIEESRKKGGYQIKLKEELDFLAFKKNKDIVPMNEYADFIPFSEDGIVEVQVKSDLATSNIKILNSNGFLRFYEDGEFVASLDTQISTFKAQAKSQLVRSESSEAVAVFEPPTFGITFLGTSHGFDETGNTTGFVTWINGNGIIVDPPASATDYFKANGIKASFVQKVILTHCHSDHDSGLLRKILDGEKIQLFTTKTIHESYKRKINAITNMNMEQYYDFIPVRIGEMFSILGAAFEFDYSLHSVPTLRFKLNFAGKSISYSADCLYDSQVFSQLVNQGIINHEREMSLRMFLFDTDLIIHESGVPPIHTSIATLNELPVSTKRKMLIVHCKQIPVSVTKKLENGNTIEVPVTDLRIPDCGVENTFSFSVPGFTNGYCKASSRFKLFSDVLFFKRVTPSTIFDLVSYCEGIEYPEGTVIIESGQTSDWFFLIEVGQVNIYTGKEFTSANLLNILRRGDTFGENALRTSIQVSRTASVVARTLCRVLRIHSTIYKNIICKEEVEESRIDVTINKVNKNRNFVSQILSSTYLFENLPPEQMNFLSSLLEEEQIFPKGTAIMKEGDTDNSMFIIKQGSVRLERTDENGETRVLLKLQTGQIFGEISLITGLPRTATVIANEEVVVLELRKKSFENLMQQYTSLRVKIALLVEQRLKENVNIQNELRNPPTFKNSIL